MNVKNKTLQLIILFFAVIQNLPAQVLTIDSILYRIEKNNPALSSYQNKINSDNALIEGAGAWMPPTFTAGLWQMPYTMNNAHGSVLFAAEQMIPNSKKISAKKEYLKSVAVLDENNSGYKRNQFFFAAKTAYYERYISERKLKILDENIETLKYIKQISELNIAYGKSDLQSIYKLDAKISAMQAMKIHEQTAVIESNTTLNYLMNQPQATDFQIDTTIQLKYKNIIIPDTAAANIELARNDIQYVTNSIHTLQLNRLVIRSNSKPEFGIRFEQYSGFGSPNAYSIMGMVTVPIVPWSSKGYKAQLNASNYEIASLRQQKQNALNEVQQMITVNFLKMKSEYSEVEKYETEILPSYKKNLDVNLIAYRQNTSELIFTLTAIDDLQNAQMEYLEHFGNLLQTQIEYEKELEIR